MCDAAKPVGPNEAIEAIRVAYSTLKAYASEDSNDGNASWELYAAEIDDVLRRFTAEIGSS